MAIFNGTTLRDVLNGTALGDTMHGNGGDDTINGNGGNDGIFGDDGNDSLNGGIGNDHIYGGKGIDALFGGDGADQLYGEAGDDYILGGAGNDYLHGGSGNDRLRGEAGDDTLKGGAGIDNLNGGAGNDLLLYQNNGPHIEKGSSLFAGDTGADTLSIDAARSTIKTAYGYPPATAQIIVQPYLDSLSASGTFNFIDPASSLSVEKGTFSGIETFSVSNDTKLDYIGGGADVTVIGGDRSDRFFSGRGNETFDGGGGKDAFYFLYGAFEFDRIVGFDPAEDVIVTSFWEDSSGNPRNHRTIVEVDGHTIITTDDGEPDMPGTDVVHILSIDAIGIPDSVFKNVYTWDGAIA
jgi:Ca2+-binding RTX toxin-like protein